MPAGAPTPALYVQTNILVCCPADCQSAGVPMALRQTGFLIEGSVPGPSLLPQVGNLRHSRLGSLRYGNGGG